MKENRCPECGYTGDMELYERKDLTVTFEGVGDKPCWRIIYGTLDTIWWGPESAFEACVMMTRNWKDWTPSYVEKRQFWDQAKEMFNPPIKP